MRWCVAVLLLIAQSSMASPAKLEDLQAFSDGVRITLDRRVSHRATLLGLPPRLIIDLEDAVHPGRGRRTEVAGPVVQAIRTSQFRVPPSPVTRIVVDLEEGHGLHTRELKARMRLRSQWQDGALSIVLLPQDLHDAVGALGQTPTVTPRQTLARPRLPGEPARIEKVDVVGDVVTINLNRAVEHRTIILQQPPRLVIDLLASRGPDRRIPAVGDVLTLVRSARYRPGPRPVQRLVFTLGHAARYRAEWIGSQLRVSFKAKTPAMSDVPQARAASSHFSGLLLDENGRALSGLHLLHFRWPARGSVKWSLSRYVRAREGVFSSDLGILPETAQSYDVGVAAPQGTGWRAFSTNPRP
jgi:hypothetical protein